MPQFAHLPLLLKPSGDGKLSKRDGLLMGFPVFPLAWTDTESGHVIPGFKEDGYLPEALINFLAFLGWNPGTEKEIYSIDELIEDFSIDRIGKAGTRFDINKAKWYNHHYLQLKHSSYFKEAVEKVLHPFTFEISDATLKLWVELVKSRSTFEYEMMDEIALVANPPQVYDEQVATTKWSSDAENGLVAFSEFLKTVNYVSADDAKLNFNLTMEGIGIKPGKVLQILRLVLTGKGAGPDLMTIIELLGPERCIERINSGIPVIKKMAAG
jgi:glutamyl-tRNA synthetase